MNQEIQELLRENHPIMGTVRLLGHYHLLSQMLVFGVPGDVVELGTGIGKSARMLAAVLKWLGSDRRLHLYDSFLGLPGFGPEDAGAEQHFGPGEFAFSEDQLLAVLGGFEVDIHAGWFSDTLPQELPESICYAHLDADLYDSTKLALESVYPRLSQGAVCVVDDYGYEFFPGAKKAADEFLASKPEVISEMAPLCGDASSHAYFRKV